MITIPSVIGAPTSCAEPLPCLFCGIAGIRRDPRNRGHEFMLHACCEGLHGRSFTTWMTIPLGHEKLLRRLEIEPLTGQRLRRVADDGCLGMILDWQLQLGSASAGKCAASLPATMPIAAFRLPGVFIGRLQWPDFGGCRNRRKPRRPRLFRPRHCRGEPTLHSPRHASGAPVERRLDALWVVAQEAERRGFQKIITYTRIDEPGTTLVASAGSRKRRIRGRGWHSTRRPRSNANGWIRQDPLEPCASPAISFRTPAQKE